MFGHTEQQLENYVNSWDKPEFIGTALWETHYPYDKLARVVELFKNRNIKCTIILNLWSQNYPEEVSKLKCNVIHFDYFLWRTYNELVVKKKSLLSTKWNSSADNFLFLTGKPQKPQRIRLLYKFAQQQLLDRCVWSLFVHDGVMQDSHRFVSELNKSQFEEFVQRHQRNPDHTDLIIQPNNLHCPGMVYNVDLFSNTKFRVISETDMTNNYPWLTEKTWVRLNS
jgi:hypothetical protein